MTAESLSTPLLPSNLGGTALGVVQPERPDSAVNYALGVVDSLPPLSLIPDVMLVPNTQGTDAPIAKGSELYYDLPRPRVGAEYFPAFHFKPGKNLRGSETTWGYVIHGTHPLNKEANNIEVEQMVELGDDVKYSVGEFDPYFDKSFVICIGTESGITGVMRISPYTTEGGIKTFEDVSEVMKLSKGVRQIAADIEAEFMQESGCTDLSKVWDITTLALAPNVPRTQYMDTIHNLLYGLADLGFDRVAAGDLTHLVSANEPKMHAALKQFGYPLEDLNGYGDLKYIIKPGQTEAMTCHPAYFAAADLKREIERPDASRYLLPARYALRVF